jgi:hypothetical protein
VLLADGRCAALLALSGDALEARSRHLRVVNPQEPAGPRL